MVTSRREPGVRYAGGSACVVYGSDTIYDRNDVLLRPVLAVPCTTRIAGLAITVCSGSRKKEATRDGAPPIELIEGDSLCDLLKSLKLGVTTEMVERIVVEADWFARV